MAYGTLSVQDLLATQKTIAEIGEDQTFLAIQTALDAHNILLREKLAQLADPTTDRQRRYGGLDLMQMDELDEFGTPDAEKVVAGLTVGFPMRLYGKAVQWTRKYFQNAGANEFAEQFIAVQDADVRNMDLQLRRTVFNPINSPGYVDRLVDNVTLYPKAFVNADGAPLPVGPNGEVFNGVTHTHYLGTQTGTWQASDVVAHVETVVEHYALGRAMIYINRAQETAMRGFAGFIPLQPVQIRPGISSPYIDPQQYPLDPQQLYNRQIGIFGNQGAEVWVKPWIPTGYAFAFLLGAPKPMALRERRVGSMGLVVAAEDEEHPLRARTLENEYGLGVWNRVNGAVMDLTHTTYNAPTLTGATASS